MRAPLQSLAALAMLSLAVPQVQAQPDMAKAGEICSRTNQFRSAAGHSQTASMAAYLKGVLESAGVPASDIETLQEGEATTMIVRLPCRSGARPILFSPHMDVADARPAARLVSRRRATGSA